MDEWDRRSTTLFLDIAPSRERREIIVARRPARSSLPLKVSSIIGGDLSKNERDVAFGDRVAAYGGAEIGGMVRIANFDLFARASWLHKDTEGAVRGLSRLQFVPAVTFRLPFDIVTTGDAKDKPAAPAAPAPPAPLPPATPLPAPGAEPATEPSLGRVAPARPPP